MLKYRPIRWLYWKTGMASIVVALIVALRFDLQWGSVFAAGALVGWLNWFFLGFIMWGVIERKPVPVLAFLAAKFLLLGATLVFALPLMALSVGAFLCGFSMFLLMGLMEALGTLMAAGLRKPRPGQRPLPEDLKELFLGSSTDA